MREPGRAHVVGEARRLRGLLAHREAFDQSGRSRRGALERFAKSPAHRGRHRCQWPRSAEDLAGVDREDRCIAARDITRAGAGGDTHPTAQGEGLLTHAQEDRGADRPRARRTREHVDGRPLLDDAVPDAQVATHRDVGRDALPGQAGLSDGAESERFGVPGCGDRDGARGQADGGNGKESSEADGEHQRTRHQRGDAHDASRRNRHRGQQDGGQPAGPGGDRRGHQPQVPHTTTSGRS